MKKRINDIFYIWKNELLLVVKDEAILILFFLVPFAYPLVYSYMYNNEVIQEVKMVVVDKSNSSLSRDFIRKVNATPEVKIVGHASDIADARNSMAEKTSYGILHIPEDFSKNIHTGQQANVEIFADMGSILFYKNMLLSTMSVSMDMGANIRVEEMSDGKGKNNDEVTMYPITNQWISLYNPANGFASFFVPAILILIIQQTLILGISTLVGTHNDRKRFAVASHTRSGKKVGALELTIGKAFCYSSLYMFICVWVLRVIPYLFNLPQIGDPLTIAVFLMPFLLSATFFAMTLSYFCSQREFSMLLFVFTTVLFIFMSGVSWPWTAIPGPLQAIAYIIPSTPGIHGFVKINTMGATLDDVSFEYRVLWIQAFIYCIFATMMYKWWIKNYDPEHLGLLHS